MRELINLSESDYRLAIGWVVASYFCEIPHPILFVQGEQGTAKTNLVLALLALDDPQVAAERSVPPGEREWAIFARAFFSRKSPRSPQRDDQSPSLSTSEGL